MNISRRRAFRGFTLIELMVVIALLASIAGIAYTSYFRYINSKDRTLCMANLREIFGYASMYSNDYRGILPCSGMPDDPRTKNLDESQGWWVSLVPYIYENPSEQPEKKTDPVMLPRKTFLCPSDPTWALYANDLEFPASPETISYASWTDNSANKYDRKSPIQVTRGGMISGLPWLSDGTAHSDYSIRTQAQFEEDILPKAERHADYICILYADGSVKAVSEPTFRTAAPALAEEQ